MTIPWSGVTIQFWGMAIPFSGTAIPFLGIKIEFSGITIQFSGMGIPFSGITIQILAMTIPFLAITVPLLTITIQFLGTTIPLLGTTILFFENDDWISRNSVCPRSHLVLEDDLHEDQQQLCQEDQQEHPEELEWGKDGLSQICVRLQCGHTATGEVRNLSSEFRFFLEFWMKCGLVAVSPPVTIHPGEGDRESSRKGPVRDWERARGSPQHKALHKFRISWRNFLRKSFSGSGCWVRKSCSIPIQLILPLTSSSIPIPNKWL